MNGSDHVAKIRGHARKETYSSSLSGKVEKSLKKQDGIRRLIADGGHHLNSLGDEIAMDGLANKPRIRSGPSNYCK
jgi:hypothetical protein